MALELHESYARDSAIAAFPSSNPGVSYLDGNFVVLDRVVVCLFFEPHYVAPADIEGLLRELERFASRSHCHLTLTRYEQDALTLHKNEHRVWLVYQRHPTDSGLHLNAAGTESDMQNEQFECACGIPEEHPAHQTVPIAQALLVARAFFEQGELPARAEWTDSSSGHLGRFQA